MAVTLVEIVAGFLYLLPILLFVALRSTRDRAMWQVALDVPFAVAIDLLSVLALTRVVTLETAILISRPAWLIGSAITLWRRRRSNENVARWPTALGRREVLGAGLAALLTFGFCSFISRRYVIWDSQWHTSIVGSLSVQKLPFANPLSKTEVLHYHFSGDVLAAMQRTLSFDVLSANAALAQAHDLMFVLTAVTLSLLVLAKARIGSVLGALAASAVLLNGPIPVRGNIGFPFLGYEYHSFITLSYRPHVPLGALLITGILAAIVIRVEERADLEAKATAPIMLACVALLAVTDETSTALLCLALGITWLAFPNVLAPSRKTGLALLALLASSIALTNLGFGASLAPGGPVQQISLSHRWRVPSLGDEFPSLPLSTLQGWAVLSVDLAPLVLLWVLIAFIGLRSKSRATLGLTFFSGVVLLVSVLLALRLEINHDPTEAHRFFVAPFFAVCVFAVLQIHAMKLKSMDLTLLLTGLAVPAMSSLYWLAEITPTLLAGHRPDQIASHDIFKSNCRTIAGAHLGDRAREIYVEESEFTRFVGCRPVFTPGKTEASWATRISPVTESLRQLRQIDLDDDQAGTIDAICKTSNDEEDDEVCRVAKQAFCPAEGTDFLRCRVTRQQRNALLLILR